MKKTLLSMLVLSGFMVVARPALADDAAALYKSKCVICHGADGKGSVAGQKLGAKDLQSPEVKKMSDDELFKMTKEGKGKMPAYDKKLTDDEIKSLVKFIRTLK